MVAGATLLAVTVLVGATLPPAPSPCSPPPARRSPSPPARLVARGAAVDVPLEVTCNATDPVEVFVTVTQRVGKGVAAGSGFASFGCTGGGQDVVVRVTANPSGKAFVRGKAVVEAEVFGCGRRGCDSETDSETVELRR
jgi:hypothetical protein